MNNAAAEVTMNRLVSEVTLDRPEATANILASEVTLGRSEATVNRLASEIAMNKARKRPLNYKPTIIEQTEFVSAVILSILYFC